MLVFEKPEELDAILPGLLPPGRVPEQGLPGSAFDRELVRALFADRPVEYAEDVLPTRSPEGFWTSRFLVDEAPASQYDLLRKVIAAAGPPPGHVACLALRGTGFHGQDKRGWAAVKGNLHLSLGLGCDLPAAESGKPAQPDRPDRVQHRLL